MCRWLAYCGEAIYLDKVLFEPSNSLISQSLRARRSHVTTNGDGFGIGWYGERHTPGVYRDILPAWNDPNLKSLSHQIRSGMFMAHVRASTGTATSRSNCHPFAHGRWLFMHNGQIGGYERIRRCLESKIDDQYYSHRLGTTDSEIIFYLMFSQGLDLDPVGAISRTIADVEAEMRRAGISEPMKLTAALSNGRQIFGIRYSTSEQAPSMYFLHQPDHYMVVSEPLDEEDGKQWQEVPSGQMLVVEPQGPIEFVPVLNAA